MRDPVEIDRENHEREEAAQEARDQRILNSDLQPWSLREYLEDLTDAEIQALCDAYNGKLVNKVFFMPASDQIRLQLGAGLIKIIDEKRLDDPDNEE